MDVLFLSMKVAVTVKVVVVEWLEKVGEMIGCLAVGKPSPSVAETDGWLFSLKTFF